MSDDIAKAIAAEEHAQGAGPTRGHCDDCRDHYDQQDRAARIAACAHDDVIEMRQLCQARPERFCQDCGVRLTEGEQP